MEGRNSSQDITGLKDLLQLWAPQLQVVVAMEMLPHLPCLSDQDKEQIIADNRNHGNSHALLTLLDRVTRCEPGWYTQFLQGLRRNEYRGLADELEGLKTGKGCRGMLKNEGLQFEFWVLFCQIKCHNEHRQ
ncbi:mitochondrial antiviral-signaling protein-like [Branchiostoma floridae x Branchiostoma belcheri]